MMDLLLFGASMAGTLAAVCCGYCSGRNSVANPGLGLSRSPALDLLVAEFVEQIQWSTDQIVQALKSQDAELARCAEGINDTIPAELDRLGAILKRPDNFDLDLQVTMPQAARRTIDLPVPVDADLESAEFAEAAEAGWNALRQHLQ